MKVGKNGHLTYCTNVHPGVRLAEVLANLRMHVAAVKREMQADRFGVGLWLASDAVRELEHPGALTELHETLDAEGLYLLTLNGFPYGPFHGRSVKTSVYQPDWLEPERLAYTNRLASILATLLPDSVDGSISTLPGAFKPRVRSLADTKQIAGALLQHVRVLHRIREETGKTIRLALEPEPCCMFET